MAVIEIPDTQAERLKAKAEALGLTLEKWLENLAGEDTPPPSSPPRRHISERIREIMADVPPEVMDAMPEDGASEHDHYVYGWPKRGH